MSDTPSPKRRGRRKKGELPAEKPSEQQAREVREASAKELGKVIRSTRQPRIGVEKVTQANLGTKARVDRNTIRQVEQGQVSPTLDILMRIVKETGLRLVVQDSSVVSSENDKWVYPPFPKLDK